jgi:raffinose/stachyose/melibiose transport system substrate-binding protein
MLKRTFLSLMAASAIALSAATAQAETVLKVWDQFSEENDNKGMQAFIAAFEAANPDIKIQRDVQSADDLRTIVQTALTSGAGPDVLYFDTGPGFAGELAKAGLLMPLDDLYAAGLDKHIYPWSKERTRFDGKVYGVGNEVEFIGVYYNADMFAELKLEVPKSYEDFVKVADALKAAGKVPVSFGNADGWPAFHIFSLFMNNAVGKEKLEQMMSGAASWDDPATVDAIKTWFVDANAAGHLIPSVNAVNYDDSGNLFKNGDAGMMVTGTWLISDISANAKFKPGWFFLPKKGGGDPLPPAGLGSGYFVNAKTANADAAKKFITFLFDPANANMWTEGMNRFPTYKVDLTGQKVPPLFVGAAEALATVPMGFNIDVLMTDKFNTAMKDGFQAVLAGSKTPEDQAKELQAAAAAK